jgi:hypothetical protein
VFAPSDRVSAFVRLYQGGTGTPSSTQVTTRILNATDAAVLDATTTLDAARFTSRRAADHLVDLPLARLPPGPYLLRIEAALGPRRILREMRFTVR